MHKVHKACFQEVYNRNEIYSIRNAQIICKDAFKMQSKASTISFHHLRHSFATHWLDKGTAIRYIKDLLGQFYMQTIERYLHVSKQKLVNIASPLDDLLKNKICNGKLA
jgi:integrase/recombinase XerD